jgi:hypothetical protein
LLVAANGKARITKVTFIEVRMFQSDNSICDSNPGRSE